MHIWKSLWLCSFLLLSLSWIKAERVFILFDENCMDRLEYRLVGQPGSYIVYQVNVAPGERITLEVGQESGEYRGNMPSPMIGCSTGIFDARMVENINRGLDEVFVINPLSNGRHTITQVSLAGEYQYNQRALAFDSPKYDFRFDLENGTIGENIAVPTTQREVFFEGRMEEQCLGAYLFRQFAPKSAKPHTDLVFVPDIGIIEERSGFTLDEAMSNALKLERVNGIPLQTHIQQMCNLGGNLANSPVVLSPYGADVTPGRVFEETPNMTVKRPTVLPNSANAADASAAVVMGPAQMHDIVKGENLFRISKKYGVTVSQLKTWNGLKSNTIYAGRQLVVSDPSSTVATGSRSNTLTGPSEMSAPNTGNNMPVPYGDDGRRLDVSVKGTTGGTMQEYHTVKTGETVASIALKYGYTEARFREMNDLGPNDYPKIGQPLKTNDCDCPEQIQPADNTYSSGRVNPYSATTPSTINNNLQSVAPSSPINNYSYPSPSNYDQNGRPTTNSNTRPFSNYNDIPVPATGTLTAPTDYSNSSYPNNQPAGYVNYDNTSIRGVNSYDNTSQSSGLKRSHIVKDGETLYDIARQYGTTIQKLRQLNRLDENDVVIPYQKIYLE